METNNPFKKEQEQPKTKSSFGIFSLGLVLVVISFIGIYLLNNGNFLADFFDNSNPTTINFGFVNSAGSTGNEYKSGSIGNNTTVSTSFRVVSPSSFNNLTPLYGASGAIQPNVVSPSNADYTDFIDNIQVSDPGTVVLENNFNTTVNSFPNATNVLRFAMIDSTNTSNNSSNISPGNDLMNLSFRVKPDAPVGEMQFILLNGNITTDPSNSSVSNTSASLSRHIVLSLRITEGDNNPPSGGGGGGGGGSSGRRCTEEDQPLLFEIFSTGNVDNNSISLTLNNEEINVNSLNIENYNAGPDYQTGLRITYQPEPGKFERLENVTVVLRALNTDSNEIETFVDRRIIIDPCEEEIKVPGKPPTSTPPVEPPTPTPPTPTPPTTPKPPTEPKLPDSGPGVLITTLIAILSGAFGYIVTSRKN